MYYRLRHQSSKYPFFIKISTISYLGTKNSLLSLQTSVTQLSNASLRPPPLEPNIVHELESLRQVVAQASSNISEANSTLTKRLQWLQDDQVKDHVSVYFNTS